MVLVFIMIGYCGMSQEAHLDQDGIRESVISGLNANALQARRYKVAEICMNSHHWQYGGFMYVEFYCMYPYPGYEKYKIELGYGFGTQSSKIKCKLLESHCKEHHVALELGEPYSANTNYGGYENVIVPIYVDTKNYSRYKAKLTYTLSKVDQLSGINQIKIYDRPSAVNISTFASPKIDHSDENFSMKNGSVAENFDVKGTITATEIKVESTGGADFVFEDDYKLKSLEEVEQFVQENNHLPDIPSAKQMEEEGVGLAEMNKLLLQKVEELTLYAIELEKRDRVKAKQLEILKEELLLIKNIILKK